MLTVPPRFTKQLAETTLTLPVGCSTAVEVPFAASPPPKVTWSLNGGKLPDPKRFKTDTISAMTSLTIAKVVRKDAGKYTVVVENEHGKCELAVTLVVLGKTNYIQLHRRNTNGIKAKLAVLLARLSSSPGIRKLNTCVDILESL